MASLEAKQTYSGRRLAAGSLNAGCCQTIGTTRSRPVTHEMEKQFGQASAIGRLQSS